MQWIAVRMRCSDAQHIKGGKSQLLGYLEETGGWQRCVNEREACGQVELGWIVVFGRQWRLGKSRGQRHRPRKRRIEKRSNVVHGQDRMATRRGGLRARDTQVQVQVQVAIGIWCCWGGWSESRVNMKLLEM